MDSSGGQAPKPGGQVIINTGGGAYVAGDVTVTDGDFVGRDQHKVEGNEYKSGARPCQNPSRHKT
jgi:hypothetical protein